MDKWITIAFGSKCLKYYSSIRSLNDQVYKGNTDKHSIYQNHLVPLLSIAHIYRHYV